MNSKMKTVMCKLFTDSVECIKNNATDETWSLVVFNISTFWPEGFRWTLRRHVSKWFWPFAVWCCDWATHFDHSPPMPFVPMMFLSWLFLQGGAASQPLGRSVRLFVCSNFAVFAIVGFVCRWHCSAATTNKRLRYIETLSRESFVDVPCAWQSCICDPFACSCVDSDRISPLKNDATSA